MKLTCLVACFILTTTSTMCYGKAQFSCAEGPPGRYCFDDLSGYHDCHVDKKTGKLVDTLHTCPNGTRCVCYLDRSCDVQEPCQKYRSPPSFAKIYTVYGETKQQVIGPMGPGPISARQTAIFQNKDDKKLRWNTNQQNFFESWFYLPSSQAQSYNEYYVRWDLDYCNKTTTKSLPFFGVPSHFTYNGTTSCGWRSCEQWMWFTGGRTLGDSSTAEYWYIYQNPNDLQYLPISYEYRLYGSAMSKTNVVSNTTYVFTEEVDDSVFNPPKQYCSVSDFQNI